MDFTKPKIALCLLGVSFTPVSQFKQVKDMVHEYPIVALNSNMGNKSLEGYESQLNIPIYRNPKKSITRKYQGNGSTFQSTIQLHIEYGKKILKAKYSYHTGSSQIPGVVETNFADGYFAIEQIKKFAQQNFGEQVEVIKINPIMINFRFEMRTNIFNILRLYDRLNGDFDDRISGRFSDMNRNKYTFIVHLFCKPVFVYIFASGKINILGANNENTAEEVIKLLNNFAAQYPETVISAKLL